MNFNYHYAIKMGIMIGIVFAIISCVNMTLHTRDFVYSSLSGLKPVFYVLLLLTDIVILLIFMGLGYKVVGHYRNFLHYKRDAIIVSAVAGGTAGIVNGIAQFTMGLIIPGIISYAEGSFSGQDAISLISSLSGIVIYVFIGNIILSVIGGLIYMVKNKI